MDGNGGIGRKEAVDGEIEYEPRYLLKGDSCYGQSDGSITSSFISLGLDRRSNREAVCHLK